MAEDLPQDSSRPQETSQDSGVSSERQLSNPTGENTVEQNNQKSQTVTNQNSQSNKKYDLGVLFVHGIGFQKPGDTFKTMYEPIKEKIDSQESVSFKEISINSPLSRSAKISTDSTDINVVFRESYWHDYPSRKSLKLRLREFRESLEWSVIIGLYRILILKFLQFRVSTVTFNLLSGVIFTMILFGTLKVSLDEKISTLIDLDGVHIIMLIIAEFIFVILFYGRHICSLYTQVQNSVSNSPAKYDERVLESIKRMVDDANRLLVISHSMGGYLSYKSLSNVLGERGCAEPIQFVGLGSGLGPMSIIDESKKFKRKYCQLLIYTILAIINLLLWFNIWVNLIRAFNGTESTLLLICNLDINIYLLLVFNILLLALIYMFVYFVVNKKYRVSFEGVYTKLHEHYEFYYPADLVGNTSRFTYSKDIKNIRVDDSSKLNILSVAFGRAVFAHDMRKYIENSRVLGFIYILVTSPGGAKSAINKEIKNISSIYAKAWIAYIASGIVAYFILVLFFSESMQNPWLGTLYISPVLMFFEYVAYFISYALVNAIGWVAELCSKYLVKNEHVKNDDPQQERDVEFANVIARTMVIFSMSPILTILALNRLDTLVLEVILCFAVFVTLILVAICVKTIFFYANK
jgi:glutathione S-transferase